MLAALILGAAGAITWGVGSTLVAPASRAMGVSRSVLWLGLVGTACGATVSLVASGPPAFASGDVGWLAGTTLALLAATNLWAVLVARSDVSLATPIVACDGAIAALAAVVAGQRLPVGVYAGLGLMVVGLVIASRRPAVAARRPTGRISRPYSAPVTVAVAIVTAGCYAAMLFCAAQVEASSPIWTVVVARGGVTAIALGICVRARVVLGPRRALGFAAASGALDVLSFSLFLFGARENLAIAAVAVSQYGVIAAIVGVLLLGERLSRFQASGVVLLAVGAGVVAMLAA